MPLVIRVRDAAAVGSEERENGRFHIVMLEKSGGFIGGSKLRLPFRMRNRLMATDSQDQPGKGRALGETATMCSLTEVLKSHTLPFWTQERVSDMCKGLLEEDGKEGDKFHTT